MLVSLPYSQLDGECPFHGSRHTCGLCVEAGISFCPTQLTDDEIGPPDTCPLRAGPVTVEVHHG